MASFCQKSMLSFARKQWGLSQVFFRPCTQKATSTPTGAKTQSAPPPPKEPVDAAENDISTYKVPEYYSYDDLSYYKVEEEMQSYRLPQPSKFNPMPPKPKA